MSVPFLAIAINGANTDPMYSTVCNGVETEHKNAKYAMKALRQRVTLPTTDLRSHGTLPAIPEKTPVKKCQRMSTKQTRRAAWEYAKAARAKEWLYLNWSRHKEETTKNHDKQQETIVMNLSTDLTRMDKLMATQQIERVAELDRVKKHHQAQQAKVKSFWAEKISKIHAEMNAVQKMTLKEFMEQHFNGPASSVPTEEEKASPKLSIERALHANIQTWQYCKKCNEELEAVNGDCEFCGAETDSDVDEGDVEEPQ